MDSWSRVSPNNPGGSASRSGGGLPAAGTVIMAHVAEELGNGQYSLRWAGNRITVTSSAALAIGQSMILKSELSEEGKVRLVVQGPALPTPESMLGKVTYQPVYGGGEGEGAAVGGSAGAAADPGVGDGVSPSFHAMLDVILEPVDILEQDIAEGLARLGGLDNESEPQPKTDGSPPSGTNENGGGQADETTAETVSNDDTASGGARAGQPAPARPDPPPIDSAGEEIQNAEDGQTVAGTDKAVHSVNPAPEKPELLPREILAQMLRDADLPAPAGRLLDAIGPLPEAVAERAAAILLRAAGLAPEQAHLDAARALVANSLPVDRHTVQALVSLVAGMDAESSPGLFAAAARLFSHDVPLSPPLVDGMASVLRREQGIQQDLVEAVETLGREPKPTAVGPWMDAAAAALEVLTVDLDDSAAGAMLERFLSSFGRHALAQSLEWVEAATRLALEGNAELAELDEALTVLLAELNEAGQSLPRGAVTPVPSDELPDQSTVPAASSAPGVTGTVQQPGTLPAPGPAAEPEPRPEIVPPPVPETVAEPKEIMTMPGANSRVVDILRPGGQLDGWLRMGGEEVPDDRAETMARTILGKNDTEKKALIRDLVQSQPALAKEVASRLARMEQAVMRQDSLLTRLAQAAGFIRDAGRQLLALKAENLAGQEKDPQVMYAEVPLSFADERGNGRMQMFYRKKAGGEGWTTRVILDLRTTGLGPVLGDMRFFGQEMTLNMFVEKAATAEYLRAESAELVDSLRDIGFRLSPRFLVLPPPPAPSVLEAVDKGEAKIEKGSDTSAGRPDGRTARLDTRA